MSREQITWQVPLGGPEFDAAEEAAVLRVLRSGWLTMGPETEALEAEFASSLGVSHAVAVSSGTAALHLALLSLGIGPGDEVVQPAINFTAAANMTAAVGAEPVFADVASTDYPVIGVSQAERAWTSRPAAVVAMHYGGYPCDVEALREYCREQDIAFIEDAAHAIGASVKGRALGTWGDVGCFSFFSNKNMAVGEGGMLVTDRDDVAQRARSLRCHGMTSVTWNRHRGVLTGYDVVANGFNYRIDEIRSAIAREQLRKLDSMNARRREHTQAYAERLAGVPGLSIVGIGSGSGGDVASRLAPSACHLLAVVVDADERDEVVRACRARGVQTSRHYPCLPELSAFRGTAAPSQVSVSHEFALREITLPLYPSLRNEDIELVCEAVCAGHAVGVA